MPATKPKATRDVSHRLDRQVRDPWFRNLRREGEIMPCIYPCVTRWYNGYNGGLSSTDP